MLRIVLIALAYCLMTPSTPALATANLFEAMAITRPKVRLPAPEFHLMTLQNSEMSLSNLRGKLVVVHFWSTSCIPCRDEMPALQNLWETYRTKGLVVLGISTDKKKRKKVESFVRRLQLSFPILLDTTGDVRVAYEVEALPTTYIIGKNGRIIGRTIGTRDWSSKQGHALIKSLLH